MFFQAVVVICNVERRSLQPRWLRKNHNSGTATMVEKDPEQRRCSAKKWSCEVVGSQLLSVFSTWSSSVLGKTEDALSWALIIDLTFHGQWHTSQVRCQPPCSGSFACYKKPSWSYQIAVVPLSKLQWHGAKNVHPSCGGHLEHLSADLYSTGGCGRITILGQLPWSKMVLQKDCAVQKCQAAKF